MIHLEDAKPGFHVWYGKRDNPEYGTITSVNKRYVFVQFLCDQSSKACRPEDLHWPPEFCAFDGAELVGQPFEESKSENVS